MRVASDSSSGEESPADVQRLLAEFAELNRRRLFGSPALAVEEVGAWTALRARLERHFEAQGSCPWKGIERRQFLRLPTHIQIQVGTAGALQTAAVRNVSEGGLFLATDTPLERGACVLLVLDESLDGGPPVEIRGRVSWVCSEQRGDEPPGMGIAFEKLKPEQREVVDRLVDRALNRP